MITNYQEVRDFIQKERFKFNHHAVNYDMFTKGKEWKLLVFYGDDEDKFFDVTRFWFIKNHITKFDGDIRDEKDFKLICELLHV